MTLLVPPQIDLYEGQSVRVLAYVEDVAGAAITQAGVSAIAYKISDLADGAAADADTLDKTQVVFDTLQTTSNKRLWPHPTGYNFAATFANADFAAAGQKSYRIEITITSGGHGLLVVQDVHYTNTYAIPDA